MKLEDCTKDEIIHYIKNECFCPTDNLEFCVLMYRLDKIRKTEHDEFQKGNDALGEYIALMKPYEGKPLMNVPDSVFKKAAAVMKRREDHVKKAETYHKQYARISKQVNECLANKEVGQQ